MTKHFPQLAADIARLPAERVGLDGELVALDSDGRPSFTALQEWYREIRGERFALAHYLGPTWPITRREVPRPARG